MENIFTMENFTEEVLQSELPVLVDFYADWCNPCKVMAPVVTQLAEELEGRCKVGKCNVEENLAIAQKYRVANIPSFVIFQAGEPVKMMQGITPARELKQRIEETLG